MTVETYTYNVNNAYLITSTCVTQSKFLEVYPYNTLKHVGNATYNINAFIYDDYNAAPVYVYKTPSFNVNIDVNKNYYRWLIPESITPENIISNTLEVCEQNNIDSIAKYTISSVIPAYIREDYPVFCEFIELYYKWLEKYKNILNISGNIKKYLDIDYTIDIFYESFYREFLTSLPRNIICNKETVLKYIKQYYQAKGTESSFNFLFKILYNLEPEYYIPHKDLLKPSDGKYVVNTVIRVLSNSNISPSELLSKKIRGIRYNTTAFVERVTILNASYYTVYELLLNKSSIVGDFNNETYITCDELNETYNTQFSAKVTNLISSIEIENGGVGYTENDIVDITDSYMGYGATAQITEVSDIGEIKQIKITDNGCEYNNGSATIISTTGSSAVLKVNTTHVVNYDGYFLNSDGCLSSPKYIQDSNYYQQYSYVIKVSESLSSYKDLIKKLIHPLGLKLFGSVYDINHLKLGNGLKTHIEVNRYFEQFPYRPTRYPYREGQKRWPECIDWSEAIDCRLNLFTELRYILHSRAILGPSYNSIERDKFRYNLSNRYCNFKTDTNYLTTHYTEYIEEESDYLKIDDNDILNATENNTDKIKLLLQRHLIPVESIDQNSINANYWYKSFTVEIQDFIDGGKSNFEEIVNTIIPISVYPYKYIIDSYKHILEINLGLCNTTWFEMTFDCNGLSSISQNYIDMENNNRIESEYNENLMDEHRIDGCSAKHIVNFEHIGNVQIKDFNNFIINDFKINKRKKTNIMPDSDIRISIVEQ